MFQPPFCPNRACPEHLRPRGRFFTRRGFYDPLCRAHRVPRFRCRSCGRGFSRQTFRADYRDHRPDLNAKLFLSMATGIGLRQTARNLGAQPALHGAEVPQDRSPPATPQPEPTRSATRGLELAVRRARDLRRSPQHAALEPAHAHRARQSLRDLGRVRTDPSPGSHLEGARRGDRGGRAAIWAQKGPFAQKRLPDPAAWRSSSRASLQRDAVHGREVELPHDRTRGLRREAAGPPHDEQQAGSNDLEPAVPDQQCRGDGS